MSSKGNPSNGKKLLPSISKRIASLSRSQKAPLRSITAPLPRDETKVVIPSQHFDPLSKTPPSTVPREAAISMSESSSSHPPIATIDLDAPLEHEQSKGSGRPKLSSIEGRPESTLADQPNDAEVSPLDFQSISTEVVDITHHDLPSNDSAATETQSMDTKRSLERYAKAREQLKACLKLRREGWGSFEFPAMDSSAVETQDLTVLQNQIDNILETRKASLEKKTEWDKCKGVIERCFTVLSPFTKNLLSVGTHAASIADRELGAKTEIEATLDYIYRQVGRLRVVGRLPNSASGLSSVELQNRSLDVKSAVIIYIAVHLSHECTRFGIGGRIAKEIFQGNKEREASRRDLEMAIQEFISELSNFGHSITFRTFDCVKDTHLAVTTMQKASEKHCSTISPSLIETFIVPFDRNERFTGRNGLLQTLHVMLCEVVSTQWNHRVALHGLGGVGKTQVAIDYVYANKTNYDQIYWISAATEATLLSGFQEIALRTHYLSSVEIDSPDPKLVAKLVLGWLRQQMNWLIVIDNLDDITIADGYLPDRAPNKHTLITTRNPNAIGIPARGLEVPLLDAGESIQMLCLLSEMNVDSHENKANEVVEELQHLPLAIEQAASYVRMVTQDFQVFLRDYRRRRAELHKWVGGGNRQYPHSLATAWSVSFEYLDQEFPVAGKLLQLLSFLNPDNILTEFITSGQSALDAEFQNLVADKLNFVEALLCLEKFSLVKWSKRRDTLSIHRLIQAVVRDKMEKPHEQSWASIVVNMCDVVLPTDITNENRSTIRRFQSQVVIPLLNIGEPGWTHKGARVMNRVGKIMRVEGKYKEGEQLLLLARRVLSALLGRDHPETLRSMNNLAIVYSNDGRSNEAAELQKETLDAKTRVLGRDHPETLRSMNNLGIVYRGQGRFVEAVGLQEKGWEAQKRVLGNEHRDTMQSMVNIAGIYSDQGRMTNAVALPLKSLNASRPSTSNSLTMSSILRTPK